MLTIVMTTYFPRSSGGEARAQGAARCLKAFIDHLISPVDIRLCISDDGSYYIEHIDHLLLTAEQTWHTHSLYTNAARHGIGASLNRAIAAIPPTDYIMYTTDDWLLTANLDITQAIQLLEDNYDLVRLGPIHPNLRCETKFNTSRGWWLHIHPGYGYCFATRPFIAKPRLFDVIGPFNEDMNAYETERYYTERVNSSNTPISIAQIGTISLAGPWEHIGEFEVGTINP